MSCTSNLVERPFEGQHCVDELPLHSGSTCHSRVLQYHVLAHVAACLTEFNSVATTMAAIHRRSDSAVQAPTRDFAISYVALRCVKQHAMSWQSKS